MVGTNAARVAAGMGADVTVLDKSLSRLRYIDDVFGHLFKNGYASQKSTAELASQADLIIGAVLVAGAEAQINQQRAIIYPTIWHRFS